jgi:hypothetical protein
MTTSGHVVRPHYVAIAKYRSFSHSNKVRGINIPPFDNLKGTPNLSVHQPIETWTFANLSNTNQTHCSPKKEWTHLPHGNLLLFLL